METRNSNNVQTVIERSRDECVAKIRQLHGNQFRVLNWKTVKQGGFLGYKSKEVVEVTAAVDDVPRRPRVKLPAMPPADVPAPQPQPQQPKSAAAAQP